MSYPPLPRLIPIIVLHDNGAMASSVTDLLLNLDASANNIPPLTVHPRAAVTVNVNVNVLVLLPETRSINQD